MSVTNSTNSTNSTINNLLVTPGNWSTSVHAFPGYAGWVGNPLLTSSLIQSSGALYSRERWAKEAASRSSAVGHAFTLDEGERLGRRDATTRFFLTLSELLSGLVFPQSNAAAPRTYTLRCVTPAPVPQVEDLVSIERPSEATFLKQIDLVKERMRERMDRSGEILTQVVPQHAYWASICNLHPEITPQTLELTYCALHFSMMVTQRFKQALECPRPIELSRLIQPIILTPAYSALPSGHATEAYMFAKVMVRLTGAGEESALANQLNMLAHRIAENRVIAGVHYPIDAAAAYVLADGLADYFIARCGSADSEVQERVFKGSKLDNPRWGWDGDPSKIFEGGKDAPGERRKKVRVLPSALLRARWAAAQEELVRVGFTREAPAPRKGASNRQRAAKTSSPRKKVP